MEKAVLKTLIYADLFDYPLKAWEIHKWLIGKKATLRQVEKALMKLDHESRIKNQGGFYFLKKKEGLVLKRKHRRKKSQEYFQKAKLISMFLKIIPWIKLVGISGGLAMENVSKIDDIDLFIVISKNKLWLSRMLILGILEILRQRRRVGDGLRQAAGKICCNVILEEDCLRQRQDLYTAHEVLQMKVLWQKDGIYEKYLEENDWAFKFLPNWISSVQESARQRAKNRSRNQVARLGLANRQPTARLAAPHFLTAVDFASFLENIAKKFQLRIMKKPKGLERIEEGALYFHPQDYRENILMKFKKVSSKA